MRRRRGRAVGVRRHGGPIGDRTDLIVVAHSFGGYTAPLVCDRVRANLLVLITAMIPSPGETAEEMFAATDYRQDPQEDNSTRAVFYHDVPSDLTAEAMAKERKPSATPGQEP